ncbi:hypothetical protein FHS85_004332 [Rhodoligotrophos appendicifer]|uniref:hypothetical protein n=1 Tax=Rhodoligotrophos appendicifer TaxID=987056 RepID=UPI001185EFF2|nr:hypothetical protein [Rhodoligotrophos appendicifer]
MINSNIVKNYFAAARGSAERSIVLFQDFTDGLPDPSVDTLGFSRQMIGRRLALYHHLSELSVATESMKDAFRAEPLLRSRVNAPFDILENHQKTTFERVATQLDNAFSKEPTQAVAYFEGVKSFGVQNLQEMINTLNGAEKNIVSYLPEDPIYHPRDLFSF